MDDPKLHGLFGVCRMKKPSPNKVSTTLRKKRSELDRLTKRLAEKEDVPRGRVQHVQKQIARLISLVEAETCKLYS